MEITNNHGISLPLAVWLMNDEYDHIHDPAYISVTKLIKPIKQTILGARVKNADRSMDISELVASRFGTAMHDSIEKAWTSRGPELMSLLGWDAEVTQNVLINPQPSDLKPDTVPVYMEQRVVKEFMGRKIGGKYDMVIDGRLFDFKTTSVYAYINARKDEDYQLQGSIYRWLNPELITDDHIYIQFIFTDWQKAQTFSNPHYPPLRVQEYPVPLLSLDETEAYVREKLQDLSRLWDAPEAQIPACTDKDLWKSPTVYKYYKDPTKMTRSTKNFDSPSEARKYQVENGNAGIIVPIEGQAKACGYCPAFAACKQKDQYHVDP